MRSNPWIGVVLAACAASLQFTAPHVARACGASSCTLSAYFPHAGEVPANLPGFYWWPAEDHGFDEDAGARTRDALLELLRFARVDGDEPELLDVDLVELPEADHAPYLVVPKAPLVPGAKYVLWDASSCESPASISDTPPKQPKADPDGIPEAGAARIEAIAAADLPEELGTLQASGAEPGTARVAANGSCSETIDVVDVEITVAHAEATKAWRDVLFYETEVDGERWNPSVYLNYGDYEPGTAQAGRARDRVYTTTCTPSDAGAEGVALGAHSARIRATIPGTDLQMSTNEVDFDLACPEHDASDASVASDASDQSEASGADCSVMQRVSGSGRWPVALPVGLALCWLWLRRARRSPAS